MKRRLMIATAIATGALLGAVFEASAEPPATTGAVVTVDVHGLRSDRGKALIAVFRSSRGFPSQGESALARAQVSIRDGMARATFRDIPPGVVAVAVLHDEDGDYEMDTGAFGIPREGYGVSRDAVRRFGPPRFEDSAILLSAGERRSVRIRMHY